MTKAVPCPTAVCMLLVFCLASLASAYLFNGHSRLSKRSAGRRHRLRIPGSEAAGELKLFFKTRGFRSVTVVRRHQSTYLECEVGGSPTPTIHWLKDGLRMTQGAFESHDDESAVFEELESDPSTQKLRLSSTKSRLYLDCPTASDEGEYTCVAENPYLRKTQSTIVKVEGDGMSTSDSCIVKRSVRGEAARVYMWTASRLEYEDNTVQLFCRGSGFPQPSIRWYDSFNNTLPGTDDQFTVAVNGDLLIRDISWFSNMGVYRCVAENDHGTHSVEAFLYPETVGLLCYRLPVMTCSTCKGERAVFVPVLLQDKEQCRNLHLFLGCLLGTFRWPLSFAKHPDNCS